MPYEKLGDSALPRIVTAVIADLVELFQAEARLAKAEITDGVNAKLKSLLGFAIAGAFGLISLLLIAQTGVFFLIARGFEAYWATLVVSALFVVLAVVIGMAAKSMASHDLTPHRTVRQVHKDIGVAKEQLQ